MIFYTARGIKKWISAVVVHPNVFVLLSSPAEHNKKYDTSPSIATQMVFEKPKIISHKPGTSESPRNSKDRQGFFPTLLITDGLVSSAE